MTTTAVIVQARMGSSRLPRKVMMTLAGKTVLAHVLGRCQAIDGVDVVCCATTDAAEDDPVAAEAQRLGAFVFRGSQRDVLDRYDRAATALGADIVVRITSDCPLVDPAVVAAVVCLRAEDGADYAANTMPPTWPHGLDCEVFTRDALAGAARWARDAHAREHVTPWLRTHPDIRRANLTGPGGAVAEHRWTLDYPEDMRFLEALFAHLPPDPALSGMEDILAVLEDHPGLAAINSMRRLKGRRRDGSHMA